MGRILVIEDDDQARQTISEILRLSGHEVFAVPNGARALQQLTDLAPDLIITDIFMPEKDGIETMMELRQRASTTPVIAISGGGELAPADYLDTARRLGAVATLRKPFGRDDLLGAVREALEGKIKQP